MVPHIPVLRDDIVYVIPTEFGVREFGRDAVATTVNVGSAVVLVIVVSKNAYIEAFDAAGRKVAKKAHDQAVAIVHSAIEDEVFGTESNVRAVWRQLLIADPLLFEYMKSMGVTISFSDIDDDWLTNDFYRFNPDDMALVFDSNPNLGELTLYEVMVRIEQWAGRQERLTSIRALAAMNQGPSVTFPETNASKARDALTRQILAEMSRMGATEAEMETKRSAISQNNLFGPNGDVWTVAEVLTALVFTVIVGATLMCSRGARLIQTSQLVLLFAVVGVTCVVAGKQVAWYLDQQQSFYWDPDQVFQTIFKGFGIAMCCQCFTIIVCIWKNHRLGRLESSKGVADAAHLTRDPAASGTGDAKKHQGRDRP